MNTLAFDGRTGAAGDMICAALIAAGGDPAVLAPIEDALPVRFDVGETTKNGIRATTVDVRLLEDEIEDERPHGHHGHGDHLHDHDDQSHGHDDHPHEHDDHSHGHDHFHDHSHAEGSGAHRTYPEVVAIVEGMGLPASVEENALVAFELLGEAEASIHGTDLAETHFHEVGADDAIADVVGACLLLADLEVDRVVTGPLSVGDGELEMDHGTYPIPAPAVVEIADRAGLTLRGGPVEAELLTPTGAAILGAVAESVPTLPEIAVTAAGYGAGRRSFPDRPNVLRALIGRSIEEETDRSRDERSRGGLSPSRGGLVRDEVAVLETNVDDVSPEVLGGLQETLAAAGALDVSVVPATMKKSRPGHLVTVVCDPADVDAVVERLALETGTLGIRESSARHRWIAERSIETATIDVAGDLHDVDVKVAATADGEVYDRSAEYDDALAVARETGLPVREVMCRAEERVREDARDTGAEDGS
ncbi:nickel pincer cofactor biosynthesis protein LarC [Halopenitus salinus]|uniref:Putative nickel insertion protein n=1 Tax=Halopenitus salinus TaxID=1198295 RepID=A0ABD5UU30_9EURY